MHIRAILIASATLFLLACVTGCATKKYVAQQTGPLQQRVQEVDKKHAQAVAQLEAKEQRDVSRIEERLASTEARTGDAARAAQLADQKALEARETARKAAELAQASNARLGDLAGALGNIDNFKVLGTEQILFRFNRTGLTEEQRGRLDQWVQKVAGLGRYVIEVKGYADPAGSREYNLALSRRRADAVVRHLVNKGVPVRRIHMIGLGAEAAAGEQSGKRAVVVTVYTP